jgi:hypothetical protein
MREVGTKLSFKKTRLWRNIYLCILYPRLPFDTGIISCTFPAYGGCILLADSFFLKNYLGNNGKVDYFDIWQWVCMNLSLDLAYS